MSCFLQLLQASKFLLQEFFQIELKVGDVLGVAGNHWDGFNKGRNHRTNRVGLYPEYKTREKLRVVQFPKYEKVGVIQS